MTRAERLTNVQTLMRDAIRLSYVNGGLIAGGGAVVVAMLIGAPSLPAQSVAGLSSVYMEGYAKLSLKK